MVMENKVFFNMSWVKLFHFIGERIRDKRKEKGLSQEELAERAGIQPTYIGQLKRCEKSATIDSLEKVTAALEISFDELFSHLQPSTEFKDNSILSRIINKLNSMNVENQKVDLDMVNTVLRYKSK
jgi:XRE family transcriptional regulator, regulator of sulfur utilization